MRSIDRRIKRPNIVKANRIGVPAGQRRCIKCREIKPLDDDHFGRRNGGKYFTSWCRACFRERAIDVARRRRAADPAGVAESKRRYSASEKGRATKQRRSFIDNNLRRQRHAGRPFQWSTQDWTACLVAWNHRCAYCDRGRRLTQEHFIPIADPDFPGTIPGNMLPACQPCNSSKQDRDPFEWIRDADRLARIVQFLLAAGATFGERQTQSSSQPSLFDEPN